MSSLGNWWLLTTCDAQVRLDFGEELVQGRSHGREGMNLFAPTEAL